MQVATRFMKCRSWLVKITVPLYSNRASASASTVSTSKMVARFVEHQHVVLAEQQAGQAQPGPLAAGQHRDAFLHLFAAEQQRAGQVENRLVLGARGGVVLQIIEHGLLLGQAGVDVLGINADLAAVAPARLRRAAAGANRRPCAGTSSCPGRCRPRSPPASRVRSPDRCRWRSRAPDSRSSGRGSAGPALCAARRSAHGCWPSARRRRSL